jgi:hypothetical protein
MSITHIPYVLRQQIAARDRYRCSYCRTAEIIAGDEFVYVENTRGLRQY